jgi:hypothetical protein
MFIKKLSKELLGRGLGGGMGETPHLLPTGNPPNRSAFGVCHPAHTNCKRHSGGQQFRRASSTPEPS